MSVVYQQREEPVTVKVTLNNDYPWHMHHHVELFYVEDGAIAVTIGEKRQVLEKGMISVALPETIHRTETPENSKALMVIVSPEFLPDFALEFLHMHLETPFFTDAKELAHVAEELHRLMEGMGITWDCADYYPVEGEMLRRAKGHLYLIFSELFAKAALVPRRQEDEGMNQRIAAYLNEHYSEQIGLRELSEALGYSKYHISHVFKTLFECSLTEYIGRLRAERAMELLKETDMAIIDVCYASGFNSLRTFYRVFEELYGKAPGTVREIITQKVKSPGKKNDRMNLRYRKE